MSLSRITSSDGKPEPRRGQAWRGRGTDATRFICNTGGPRFKHDFCPRQHQTGSPQCLFNAGSASHWLPAVPAVWCPLSRLKAHSGFSSAWGLMFTQRVSRSPFKRPHTLGPQPFSLSYSRRLVSGNATAQIAPQGAACYAEVFGSASARLKMLALELLHGPVLRIKAFMYPATSVHY